MTKDDLQKLIEQCNANEAQAKQQLEQVVGQINKITGAREMAQHLLNEMDKPVAETAAPKVKRGRKKKAVVDADLPQPNSAIDWDGEWNDAKAKAAKAEAA